MKMIVFLVLAGLSLAAGQANPSSGFGCLDTTLQTAPAALQSWAAFICAYRGKFDGNVKNYEAAFNNLKVTLTAGGCKVDEVLGTDATIANTAGSVTDIADQAGRVAIKLTDALDLTPALTDVLCKLLNGALTSTCLKNILANLTPQLLNQIYDVFCKNNINALSAATIYELLKNIGCFADDTIGTKDAVEQLIAKLGEGLAPALQNVLQGLAGGIVAAKGSLVVAGPLTDLTSAAICTVLNLLKNNPNLLGVLTGGLGGLGGLPG
ncbi:uncharacterized protein LOC143788102 isoform X3 [Ranitomeya variabilis]|uniref:uncharacterized protein LOC143788102 isoform X3 n=1 Tax=Ranitomeya variabilis TaxID=490064 RepID=UPI004057C0ED